MRSLAVTLLLSFVISGCSLTGDQLAARLPPRPTPEQQMGLAHRWGDRFLKDPESARYGAPTAPEPGWSFGPFYTIGQPGWVWQGGLNSKNSFGGYVGARNYWWFYAENGLIYAWEDVGDWAFSRAPFHVYQGRLGDDLAASPSDRTRR